MAWTKEQLEAINRDNSNNIVPLNDSICTNITLSAAAFVPRKHICAINYLSNIETLDGVRRKRLRRDGLQDRLREMLDKTEL